MDGTTRYAFPFFCLSVFLSSFCHSCLSFRLFVLVSACCVCVCVSFMCLLIHLSLCVFVRLSVCQ